MPLEVEVWHKTIQGKIFQDNSFLNHISDVSEDNVINGTIVHIPQSGEPSKVVKNRTTLPAEVKMRKDSEVLYKIDEYTTDPVHIKNAETKELSYDNRMSVLNEDVQNLSQEVAEGMLTNMVVSPVGDNKELPKDNILLTTGANVAATAPGATGEVKAAVVGDLQRMRNFFKKTGGWSEGNMFALLTTEMETQLFPADSMLTATYMAQVTEAERRAGVIAKVQGWNLLSRSYVYTMKADKTFKAFGAVSAADDVEGSLFWNKNNAEKAIGTTEAFEDLKNPQYYGDIYSFLVRMGGRAKRKGYEGIGVLMQAKVS